MNHQKHHQGLVIPYWSSTLLLLLGLPFFTIFFSENKNTETTEAPAFTSFSQNLKPITRWNRLTLNERSALNDNDPTTNVSGFHTGFRVNNGTGSDLLVDISVSGAPSSANPGSINNRFSNRWGLTSWNNAREAAGESGTKYCFDFTIPIVVEVNSAEHQFFSQGERVIVTAFDGVTPVNLNGNLSLNNTSATISGSGTPQVEFDANSNYKAGLFWSVNSGVTPVDQLCVEYFRTGTGQGFYGREPYTIFACLPPGPDTLFRFFTDDPWALSHPENPVSPVNIRDNLTLTKETICVEPASSNIAGNMDVTFRMTMDYNGNSTLLNLQIEDDLRDYLPGGSFVRVVDTAFIAGTNLTTRPDWKSTFDGVNAIQLFDGQSGSMTNGQTMIIDLTVEMDPNSLTQFDSVINQAFAFGIDGLGSHVTATSDAPAGSPGDLGDPEIVDGTILYIPSIAAGLNPSNYVQNPLCAAGDVEVTLELTIQNTGNTDLDEITANLDLETALGVAFLGIKGAPVITSQSFNPVPALNANYDGTALNASLIDDPTVTFSRNDSMTVEVTVMVDPNAGSFPLTTQANVSGRGLSPNQAPLPGCIGGELIVSDLSDGGLVVESQNNGFIGNTGGDDDPLLLSLPNLGLAKQLVSFAPASSNVAGNLEVTFRLILKNTGSVPLRDISLTDDIVTMLGSTFVNVLQFPFVSSSNALATPVIGVFPNIFDGTSGTLLPNEIITVDFRIEVDPDAANSPVPLTNTAQASSSGPGLNGFTVSVTDVSDAGVDPESINGAMCDDDPLNVELPAIRIAQQIVGVTSATSGTPGNFDLIMEVVAQNVGNVDLRELSLLEDLTQLTQLGNAFVNVTSAPQILAEGSNGALTDATVAPNTNPGYDGTNDLLLPSGDLKSGEKYILRYQIEINPDAPGAPNNLRLQVNGSGVWGPVSQPGTVSDLSDDGLDPNSNNINAPGHTGGSNDPTLVGNCFDELSGGISCNDGVQVSLNENCMANLTPPMVLEGEEADCANQMILPLGTYYEIMTVKTLLGVVVPDGDPTTVNVHEIDGSFIGQSLSVKVREVVNGNTCWGFIHLEDKMGPTFDCPADPIMVACDAAVPSSTAPDLIDNCDPNPTVNFAGELVIDSDICDGVYKIQRTYTGHDNMDNPATSQCIIEIHLNRGPIDFPSDVSWHCEQYADFPNIIDPTALNSNIVDTDLTDPSDIDAAANLSNAILQNTGSGVVANTEGVCGYNVLTDDEITATCGGSFKIVRTWTVIDWCTGQVISMDAQGNDNIQLIKIEDKVAPVISKTPFEVNANIESNYPFFCVSQGYLPPPDQVTDNCGSDWTVQIVTPIGAADYIGTDGSSGGFIPSPGLPLGQHDVVYSATDACGNTGSVVVQITIADTETPVAVCDEVTEVSLSTNGLAEVLASTFDDGSSDNCCIDRFEVRRMVDPCADNHNDLVFGPSVTFCCNDVGDGPQAVIFRVYDCNNNFNDCMVQAVVSDKQNPSLLTCPSTQTIDCDTYATDFETQLNNLAGDETAQNELLDAAFGTPQFYDNCSFTLTKNFSRNISQCLEGTMTRRWRAVDPDNQQSQECVQTININHVSDWVVEFPEDLNATCGMTLPDFGEPTIFNETCEMIAISFTDDTLNVVPDACFKIVRTWAVINWCVVGDEVDQEVVEVPEDELNLQFPFCDLDGDGDCDDRTFRDSWNASDMPGENMATVQFGPDTDPDSDPWDGYIVYEQTMKVEDFTDPVFTGGCNVPEASIVNDSCDATVTLPTLNGTIMDCSPSITVTVNTDMPNGLGFGPYTNVPSGIYNVTYTARDNCNNSTTCSTTVEVTDRKKPTVVCKDGIVLVIDTMAVPPNVTLNAMQLDDGSSDNCSDIVFSFSPDTTFTDTTFLCGAQSDSIEVWVTDELGNQDFCKTFVEIQPDTCPDDPLVVFVGGFIDTENGEPVENVEVNLSGQSTGYSMTDLTGDFQFDNLPLGNDLSVSPVKDDDPLNGVTTYDLVQITRHILGVQPLDSPYKMIAADANRSGAITTFDLVEIRKLVLYIHDSFPSNTSWRFVPKDYQFPNVQNPWSQPFPEVININNLPSEVLDADFVAIKIGDVNGSAQANAHSGPEDRSQTDALVLETANQLWQKGELVTISLTAKEFQAIGFQFTLQFDPEILEFVDAQPCLTDAGHIGRRFANDGFLTVSWNEYQQTVLPDQPLLQVAFRSLLPGQLNQSLRLSDRYTPPEAYNALGEIMDIHLAISESPAGEFELLQNVPNPFSESTTIGFRTAENTTAVLTITDISGRVVKQVLGDFPAGYSEIQLERADLPESGIFYYRLDTPRHTDTKMMLLVR
ncbi:MAG: hypothetical protein AAFZ15_27030 [Bacteroidota bacterium]